MRRAAIAVLAVVGLAGVAVGVLGWRRNAREVDEIDTHTRALAEQAVSFTIAGVEHAMLQGKGVMIKELVERFRVRVPDADVHIFDHRGFEVFHELPPPPAKTSLAPDLVKVLDGGPRRVTKDNRVLRPLADEERCRPCHKDEKPLRGVLAMTPHPDVAVSKRNEILPAVLHQAFIAVMTSEHAYMLDDFFNHLLATAPNLRAVGVYGNDGLLRFGKEVSGLTRDELQPSLVPGGTTRVIQREGHAVALVPLPKEQRCQACHKKDSNPVRGVLAVSMNDLADRDAATQELETIVDNSIRVYMVSSLGRLFLKFLRAINDTGAMTDIVIYDNVGRTYFSGAPATPPPIVKRLLETPTEHTIEDATHASEGRVLIARSLANEGKCITCHGTESKIRGIVTMTLAPSGDPPRAQAMRMTTLFTAIAVGGGFLIVLALLLLRRQTPA